MLSFFLSLLNLARCVEYRQQLVFGNDYGKDGAVRAFCDFMIKPQIDVKTVTIFMKTGDNDQAVPKGTVRPFNSPTSPGHYRVEIPGYIEKNGNVYNFQFDCANDVQLHSEPWTWDPETQQFSLTSAVKKKFYKSKAFYGILACTGAVVLIGMSSLIYRAIKKSKSTI